MLSLFQGPAEWVHFIDMREGQISFLLTEPKNPGSTMKVRFPLAAPSRIRRRDVAVTVTASRPARGGGYICVAAPNLNPAETAKLAEQLSLYCSSQPRAQEQVRQTDRSPVSLRVLGRDIPFFRAVATDLSPGGVKIQCQGLMHVGTRIQITLETDVRTVPDLVMHARVAWTLRPPSGKNCTVGLQFIDVLPAQARELERYLAAISRRDHVNVNHQLTVE